MNKTKRLLSASFITIAITSAAAYASESYPKCRHWRDERGDVDTINRTKELLTAQKVRVIENTLPIVFVTPNLFTHNHALERLHLYSTLRVALEPQHINQAQTQIDVIQTAILPHEPAA